MNVLSVNRIDGNIEEQNITPIETFIDDINRIGFVDNSQTELTLTGTDYNIVNLNLAAGKTQWEYYFGGIKYIITSNKSVTLSATTTGAYYIYIDNTEGTLKCSDVNVFPDILSVCIVSAVIYNSSCSPKGLLISERHTILMDKMEHYYLHVTRGCQKISGGAVSGYNLSTDINSDHTYGIAEGYIADEDLIHKISELAKGQTYTLFYRTSSNNWSWLQGQTYPFLYTASGRLNKDTSSGLVQVTNNYYINSYLFLSNIYGEARHFHIMGQVEHSTKSSAINESILDLSLTSLQTIMKECVAIYKFTWLTKSAYNSIGRCSLENVQQILTSINAFSGTTASQDHQSLSNRNSSDAHPATAISTDITNFNNNLSSADDTVQKALDTIDDLITSSSSDDTYFINMVLQKDILIP